MKHVLQAVLLLTFICSSTASWSADKVTIIPLNSSSAKGSDKQVQYNNNGSMAGSEVYYNSSNQRLGVGTDTPSYLFHVKDSIPSYLVGIHNTSTSTLATGMVLRADGGNPLLVQRSGGLNAFLVDRNGSAIIYANLTVHGDAAKPDGGTWSDYSDKRLKENIGPLQGALDKISQLQGITYQWKNPEQHGDKEGIQAGFLAQDVEKIFPGWVAEIDVFGNDKELIDEQEKAKSLNLPHEFDAYLVEAIKALKAENDALKALVCLDHPDAEVCQ